MSLVASSEAGTCFACKKRVEPYEGCRALGNLYHELCFTCFRCPNAMKKFFEHNQHAYCERCFAQYHPSVWNANRCPPRYVQSREKHFIAGQKKEVSKPAMICVVCKKPVTTGQFYSPQKPGGKPPDYYHEACFRCSKCNTLLTSGYQVLNGLFVCMACKGSKDKEKYDKQMEKYNEKMRKYEEKMKARGQKK